MHLKILVWCVPMAFIMDFHKMVTFETDELDQNFTFCCLIKRFIKIALTQNECACSLILIIGLSHHPEAKLFPSHESSFQNWNFFLKSKERFCDAQDENCLLCELDTIYSLSILSITSKHGNHRKLRLVLCLPLGHFYLNTWIKTDLYNAL